jgi:hypothetical protein
VFYLTPLRTVKLSPTCKTVHYQPRPHYLGRVSGRGLLNGKGCAGEGGGEVVKWVAKNVGFQHAN